MADKLLEVMYIIVGIIILYNAYGSLRNRENKKSITTTLFWLIMSLTFILPNLQVFWGGDNPFVSRTIIGYAVTFLAVLSLFKAISSNNFSSSSTEYKLAQAKKIGALIFVPAVSIGVLSYVIFELQDKLEWNIGSIVSLGIAIVISLVIALLVTKEKPVNTLNEGRRLLDLVGPMSILPQVLAALGAVFTTAKVGDYISLTLGGVIPESNILIGVIAYCVGMAVFTIIMGNGFAAFAVITSGIGVPFVIANGGDPVVVGALGLTAGYCGTLVTPMAANFNIVPTSILEIKDRKWGIIKFQAPFAVILLVIHIILMYNLAF